MPGSIEADQGRPFSMTINATLHELATDPTKRLTALQYRVRDLLLSSCDKDGLLRATTVEIAEAVGGAQPDTSRALLRLAELGLIRKVRNGLYLVEGRAAKSKAQAQTEKAARKAHQARKEAVEARTHLRAVK